MGALIVVIPSILAGLLLPYVPIEWSVAGCCAIWIVAFDIWILIRLQNLERTAAARTDASEPKEAREAEEEQRLEKQRKDMLTGEATCGPYNLEGGDGLKVRVSCAGEVKVEIIATDGRVITSTIPSSSAEKTERSMARGHYLVKVIPVPTSAFPMPKHVDIEVVRIPYKWYTRVGRMRT